MDTEIHPVTPNILAQRHSEEEAQGIIKNNSTLAISIVNAYRIHQTAEGVLEALGDILEMRNHCCKKTCVNTILLVVNTLISSQELDKIRREKRSEISRAITDKVSKQKMENGTQIFDAERAEHLIHLDETTPTSRNKFNSIAIAMNIYFKVDVFTRINCAKKVANIKRERKLSTASLPLTEPVQQVG